MHTFVFMLYTTTLTATVSPLIKSTLIYICNQTILTRTSGNGGSITYTPTGDGSALIRGRDNLAYVLNQSLYPPVTRLRHIRHNGRNHYEYYVPHVVANVVPGPIDSGMSEGKKI
jgi:hypothetical protein